MSFAVHILMEMIVTRYLENYCHLSVMFIVIMGFASFCLFFLPFLPYAFNK